MVSHLTRDALIILANSIGRHVGIRAPMTGRSASEGPRCPPRLAVLTVDRYHQTTSTSRAASRSLRFSQNLPIAFFLSHFPPRHFLLCRLADGVCCRRMCADTQANQVRLISANSSRGGSTLFVDLGRPNNPSKTSAVALLARRRCTREDKDLRNTVSSYLTRSLCDDSATAT